MAAVSLAAIANRLMLQTESTSYPPIPIDRKIYAVFVVKIRK